MKGSKEDLEDPFETVQEKPFFLTFPQITFRIFKNALQDVHLISNITNKFVIHKNTNISTLKRSSGFCCLGFLFPMCKEWHLSVDLGPVWAPSCTRHVVLVCGHWATTRAAMLWQWVPPSPASLFNSTLRSSLSSSNKRLMCFEHVQCRLG